MADKQFNARIRWKRDTSANWTSNNPVLLNGEIIIVDTDSGEMRFKIGDGVKTYTQLPFEDEVVRNLININTSAITKLNGDDTTEGSVAKAIADAKSIIDADIDAVEVKADAAQTSVNNLANTVAYIKEDNENIENPDIAASSIIIDSALSRTSANPVQNATITAELDTIKDAKADWNQNDETAIDFVRNRTHYDSRVIKTIEKTFENITETKPVKLADANIDINRIVSYSVSGTDGENTYNIIVTDILIDDISEMFDKPAGSVFDIKSNKEQGPIMNYFAVPFEMPDQSGDGSGVTVTYHGLYSVVDAGDILVKFEINIESGELKQIDSKFIPEIDPSKIKDMYYEEAGTDTKGLSYNIPITTEESTHEEIPFEVGQKWNVYTNGSTLFSENEEVKKTSNGILYIGDYPTPAPYYVTKTTVYGLSFWINNAQVSSITITCVESAKKIHKIPIRYLPDNAFTQDNAPAKFGMGSMSVVEGDSKASGMNAHAEGTGTSASGDYSHAEGNSTTASGESSHAEGAGTSASGDHSHAEGFHTSARGHYSHAEGFDTNTYGVHSHAEGNGTIASALSQHVQGEYNIPDTSTPTERGMYADIVGNGKSSRVLSNAYTLDWDGNGWFAGDVYVGSTSGTKKDSGSKKLIKEGDDIIIQSSTKGSTKKFKITVDDSGTISATEVTK